MNTKQLAVSAVCAAFLFAGCGSAEADPADRETIHQVSLLQGLMYGDYNGSLSVAELKKLGDTGIGTFDALNGELIMLDGTVYRAAGDGSVEAVSDEEQIPFANVTFFDVDKSETLTDVADVNALKEVLNERMNEFGKNRFYMVKIRGNFPAMHVRSELAQEEPYQPLADVLEQDQTCFDYENIEGTVVGLYCPDYMDRLNAAGWHFHFLSDDQTCGGHVLDLYLAEAEAEWDSTDRFSMILPDNEAFREFDLSADQSEDIKKVETGE